MCRDRELEPAVGHLPYLKCLVITGGQQQLSITGKSGSFDWS